MIDGRLTLAGCDASTFTLRRLLNAVYAMLADGKDEKEIAKLDASLEGPDSAAEIRLQARAQAEIAAAMGMAAQ